jgi:hypothetical protein
MVSFPAQIGHEFARSFYISFPKITRHSDFSAPNVSIWGYNVIAA